MSKADLHIHSRYSNRSAEWIARKFGFPDSYSEPRKIYDALKARGMDFVTITDHNRIEGCLDIANHPGIMHSASLGKCRPLRTILALT